MHQFKPIFLLGPGRSGTTLLYKMLSLHPDIGFISHYDRESLRHLPTPALTRLLAKSTSLKQWAWFNQTGNAYYASRSWLRKIIPMPIEGETIFSRAGLMLTEYETAADDNVLRKLRQELERLQKYQNSHVLLVKRTANNRRIPCLAAAFPDAKYIFLVRDGRSVAASLTKVHWWNEHSVWWANRQTPLQMQAEGENMLGIAAKNWTEEMRCINEGLRHVMKKDVMMIRYEDILTNPHKCIHLILQHIGVNPLEVHDHAISNLELSDSMSWKKWNKEEMDRVLSIQTDFLRQYGYL